MHGMHESNRTAEVDSEAAEAGLKAAGSAGSAPGDGSALSLQAAREAIDRVEPGSPEESWLWIKLSQAHDEEGRILFEPDPAWDPGIEPRDDGSFPPSRCPNVEDGALTFGYQMPLNAGAPSPLPDDQLRLFHDWIEAGAPGPAE